MENYNPFSLKGKTILITGASSGIGRATAIECSRMGATLIITGRNEERLNETLSLLENEGNISIIADISKDEGIKELLIDLPKLDGIVLCAGIVELWPFLFASRERIEKTYSTNLFSPIETIRMIVKKKLYNPGVSIVAIDSIAGTSDFCPANSIYGSGKAALASFLKYAAIELSQKGIRINTISPGFIYTPMQTNGNITEEQLDKVISKTPIQRWGKPEDIAYATIYLLSDASSFITGTDLKVDGGYTIPYKS